MKQSKDLESLLIEENRKELKEIFKKLFDKSCSENNERAQALINKIVDILLLVEGQNRSKFIELLKNSGMTYTQYQGNYEFMVLNCLGNLKKEHIDNICANLPATCERFIGLSIQPFYFAVFFPETYSSLLENILVLIAQHTQEARVRICQILSNLSPRAVNIIFDINATVKLPRNGVCPFAQVIVEFATGVKRNFIEENIVNILIDDRIIDLIDQHIIPLQQILEINKRQVALLKYLLGNKISIDVRLANYILSQKNYDFHSLYHFLKLIVKQNKLTSENCLAVMILLLRIARIEERSSQFHLIPRDSLVRIVLKFVDVFGLDLLYAAYQFSLNDNDPRKIIFGLSSLVDLAYNIPDAELVEIKAKLDQIIAGNTSENFDEYITYKLLKSGVLSVVSSSPAQVQLSSAATVATSGVQLISPAGLPFTGTVSPALPPTNQASTTLGPTQPVPQTLPNVAAVIILSESEIDEKLIRLLAYLTGNNQLTKKDICTLALTVEQWQELKTDAEKLTELNWMKLMCDAGNLTAQQRQKLLSDPNFNENEIIDIQQKILRLLSFSATASASEVVRILKTKITFMNNDVRTSWNGDGSIAQRTYTGIYSYPHRDSTYERERTFLTLDLPGLYLLLRYGCFFHKFAVANTSYNGEIIDTGSFAFSKSIHTRFVHSDKISVHIIPHLENDPKDLRDTVNVLEKYFIGIMPATSCIHERVVNIIWQEMKALNHFRGAFADLLKRYALSSSDLPPCTDHVLTQLLIDEYRSRKYRFLNVKKPLTELPIIFKALFGFDIDCFPAAIASDQCFIHAKNEEYQPLLKKILWQTSVFMIYMTFINSKAKIFQDSQASSPKIADPRAITDAQVLMINSYNPSLLKLLHYLIAIFFDEDENQKQLKILMENIYVSNFVHFEVTANCYISNLYILLDLISNNNLEIPFFITELQKDANKILAKTVHSEAVSANDSVPVTHSAMESAVGSASTAVPVTRSAMETEVSSASVPITHSAMETGDVSISAPAAVTPNALNDEIFIRRMSKDSAKYKEQLIKFLMEEGYIWPVTYSKSGIGPIAPINMPDWADGPLLLIKLDEKDYGRIVLAGKNNLYSNILAGKKFDLTNNSELRKQIKSALKQHPNNKTKKDNKFLTLQQLRDKLREKHDRYTGLMPDIPTKMWVYKFARWCNKKKTDIKGKSVLEALTEYCQYKNLPDYLMNILRDKIGSDIEKGLSLDIEKFLTLEFYSVYRANIVMNKYRDKTITISKHNEVLMQVGKHKLVGVGFCGFSKREIENVLKFQDVCAEVLQEVLPIYYYNYVTCERVYWTRDKLEQIKDSLADTYYTVPEIARPITQGSQLNSTSTPAPLSVPSPRVQSNPAASATTSASVASPMPQSNSATVIVPRIVNSLLQQRISGSDAASLYARAVIASANLLENNNAKVKLWKTFSRMVPEAGFPGDAVVIAAAADVASFYEGVEQAQSSIDPTQSFWSPAKPILSSGVAITASPPSSGVSISTSMPVQSFDEHALRILINHVARNPNLNRSQREFLDALLIKLMSHSFTANLSSVINHLVHLAGMQANTATISQAVPIPTPAATLASSGVLYTTSIATLSNSAARAAAAAFAGNPSVPITSAIKAAQAVAGTRLIPLSRPNQQNPSTQVRAKRGEPETSQLDPQELKRTAVSSASNLLSLPPANVATPSQLNSVPMIVSGANPALAMQGASSPPPSAPGSVVLSSSTPIVAELHPASAAPMLSLAAAQQGIFSTPTSAQVQTNVSPAPILPTAKVKKATSRIKRKT